MGSSEQNDTPFAGTLLSSPSSLPEHNGSMSVAGRVAKISDVSEKLIAARSGAGVGWSFVQPRAAGSAHCARKRKERHCCCRLGAGCRKQRILGGLVIYRVSDSSDAQQLKTWLFFHLSDDGSARSGVCEYYSLFHRCLKTSDSYSFL